MHRLAIVAAALTVALVLADPASAASNKGPSPFAAQIKELHDVKVLLEMANHDYKGHRAKAVEALDAVVDQLDKALKFARG